jgi:DNA-binding helix-hairpin-helix protein with protein kinase domain
MSGRRFLHHIRVTLGVRSVLLAGIISAAHNAMSVMPVSERLWVVDYIQHEVICVERAMSPKERRRSSGDTAYVIACIQGRGDEEGLGIANW